MRIAICDVGVGNLRSVERALLCAGESTPGINVAITSDPEQIRAADKIVMPGQGGFGDCARNLASGLGDVIREAIERGVPYLGICLGLQVLFESSEEAPGCAGLSIFRGHVGRLKGGIDPSTGGPLKIPHVGWNAAQPSPTRGLLPAESTYFYFVHSFVVRPEDSSIVAATNEYGERFVSAIAKDNVFACQFHPEKSQRAGLLLLERFIAL